MIVLEWEPERGFEINEALRLKEGDYATLLPRHCDHVMIAGAPIPLKNISAADVTSVIGDRQPTDKIFGVYYQAYAITPDEREALISLDAKRGGTEKSNAESKMDEGGEEPIPWIYSDEAYDYILDNYLNCKEEKL